VSVFTVLGASGFIGRHLGRRLEQSGHSVRRLTRDDPLPVDQDLGHVVYCIGVTADFRTRPFQAIEAHVRLVVDVLTRTRFASFLYLSSTRVYARSTRSSEDSTLGVLPLDPSDLYNLSKLLGEAACFTIPRDDVRVVRLSNVYGNDADSMNFLPSLVRDAVSLKKIRLHTALDSEKDYVSVHDVTEMLPAISLRGRSRIYNVASGVNATHADICDALARSTGCEVQVAPEATRTIFPLISIDRLRSEFGFVPRRLLEDLDDMVNQAQGNDDSQ
jgi:nucleoside-diphosphate-sugar epimerase